MPGGDNKIGGVGKPTGPLMNGAVPSPPSGECPSPKKKGEVTLAKEAAATVSAWLGELETEPERVIIPAFEIQLVLNHYAKLTKPKVNRKGRYVKGREYEYEVRDYFLSRGLQCRRVTQSGGGVEKDDLVLTTGFGSEYRLECKRVAKLPAYLINETEATIFRMDNGKSLVLTTLERFADHCQ
jgi:hypothetical protein